MRLKNCSSSRKRPPDSEFLTPRSSSVQFRARLEEELEQVFKKFDVNGDGKISVSELTSIMGSLRQPPTGEKLEKMMKEVEFDGYGFINLCEFIEVNTKDVNSNEVLENLKDAFSVINMDKNGSISADELHGEDCSLAECKKMISDVDANGDEIISFDEFKVVMMVGSHRSPRIEERK